MTSADFSLESSVLAGRILNRNSHGGSPGTRFIQRDNTAKVLKAEARHRVLELFFLRSFAAQLRILTFPSTNWIFEGALLNSRQQSSHALTNTKRPVGVRTMLVGIEREEAIYRSALNFIPSVKLGFRTKECPPLCN